MSGWAVTTVAFGAALVAVSRAYLKLLDERAHEESEFNELELAWGQLRSAVRQLCADVEASRPKRGADGRFVDKP